MNQAKIFITFTLLPAFTFQISAQKNKSVKSQILKLSVSDKTEIINQVFADGFEKLMNNAEYSAFQTCLIPLVENEKIIFVSTEIEKEVFQLKIEGFRFIVMSNNQMRKRIEREKGECHFKITQFSVSDAKVKVTFARMFNLPTYIHGIGFQYEFEKIDGKWKRRLLGNYRIDS